MNDKTKPLTREDVIKRLNRIEGQVRGIRKMVEEERACSDVLKQISAVSGAMHGVARVIVENHLSDCLLQATDDQSSRDEIINHLVDVFKTFLK